MTAYTFKEDLYIARYWLEIPDRLIAKDLSRDVKSVQARVKRLRANGGWEHLKAMLAAQQAYILAANPKTSTAGLYRELAA